ncbi:hypothetical protein GUITHDRAFT_114938 [Guillardia theta CCMP2712]|uniref:Haloacid dehalogenase-like hydrolase n=1 Tax=Guillardia theta (strain CCMP2712) TaxID=905079 RepID=L1IS48_GUITC|nr:hypothetical protein GUITHDRAFT_114938 [Guillardia theta CCMP2712]EKX39063.1 hypothetical protein GUITHDRAFT_114938 [Guillardia theta CCMP2712]|eukprot:XP_005826043.1 hypothetical protein GUITHDRAFT_114938 [Guillardia theta CCMP2712]
MVPALLLTMQARAMGRSVISSLAGFSQCSTFILPSPSATVSSLRPDPWYQRARLGTDWLILRRRAKTLNDGRRHVHHDFTMNSVRTSSEEQQTSAPYTPIATRPLVISFDLDDTLWPTVDVVMSANRAMESWLNLNYPGTPNATAIQGIMKAERERARKECEELGVEEKPMSYTEMRITALRLATEAAGYSRDEAEAASKNAFDVWLQERNAAGERLLFPGAVSALQEIKSMYPDVLFGAITNGRANVTEMGSLRSLFDFSVSAEEPEVFPDRKPSTRIFWEAVTRAEKRLKDRSRRKDIDSLVPHLSRWIHVGDDLVNDILPAGQIGMRTVWIEGAQDRSQAFYSTMSADEKAKKDTLIATCNPDFAISAVNFTC